MYAVIVGGGKAGANVARALLRMGHEVSIVEHRPTRFATLEAEFEHMARCGDGTELFVLEAAGTARADVCIAVTGDDEDNIIIGQLSRDHFGVANVVARVNDPRNQEHFDLLGIAPTVCATESILALIEHEVPQHSLVHLFSLRRENLDILEIGVVEGSRADGATVGELSIPDGSLVISVLRNRVGRVARPDTLLAAGDQVVAIAEPGRESDLMEIFAGD
ncbi:MAG: TrkA family potassium uptake protein [Thermoleophilia bacterium]|nr:TrkA family potassium uptake protein [Thermoleophilia bacterium]